jgi:signal transduction histidine kinase
LAAQRPATRVDLAAVVAERLQFWSALAEDEGRSCQVSRFSPCPVALPRDELAAAVDALVGNVLRHTPIGTTFAVTCRDHSLVVEDAGPGIADPAYALRRGASGVGSTGLGLDIARHAAEATGGTITIDSSPLGGARVRLTFGP